MALLWIVLVLLIVYILFFTPHAIVNTMLGYRNDAHLTYVVDPSEGSDDGRSYLEKFTFSHHLYDGKLMAMRLHKAPLTYSTKVDTPATLYHDYQVVEYKTCSPATFSSFTCACAAICADVFRSTDRTKLNISVVVGKRHHLSSDKRARYGNFLSVARYTVFRGDTHEQICRRHHEAVQEEVRNKRTYAKLYSMMYHYWSSDIFFNSQRDLSVIARQDDGVTMRRLNKGHFHDEAHMRRLLHEAPRILINMDKYDDDRWVISSITSLPVRSGPRK